MALKSAASDKTRRTSTTAKRARTSTAAARKPAEETIGLAKKPGPMRGMAAAAAKSVRTARKPAAAKKTAQSALRSRAVGSPTTVHKDSEDFTNVMNVLRELRTKSDELDVRIGRLAASLA